MNCNKFEEACACQTCDIVPGCQPLVLCSTVASVQNTNANEFLAKLKPNVTELLTKKTSEQLAAPFFREGAQPQDHAETIKHIVSSTAATIFATVRFHVNMRKNTPSYGEVQASIFKAVLLKKNLPPNVTALTPELCSRNAPLPPTSLTATTPARTRELRSEEGPFSSNGQFNLPHQTSVTSTTMAPTRELCSGNGPLSSTSLAATTTAPTRELCSGNGPLFLNDTSIEVSDSELRPEHLETLPTGDQSKVINEPRGKSARRGRKQNN